MITKKGQLLKLIILIQLNRIFKNFTYYMDVKEKTYNLKKQVFNTKST